MSTLVIVIALLGIATVCWMAVRDHRAERAIRRSLLDACQPILDDARLGHGKDGYPYLEGGFRGRKVRADFVPDTMTIRRLPQLWLSLTLFAPKPGRPEFALLVRPSGTEFYSLTGYLDRRLDPIPGLPDEMLLRGSGPGAQALLEREGPLLVSLFHDPRIKEVGVMAKGLRLVWQSAEGRRGEHLLLRQSAFDDAAVRPHDLTRLLTLMCELDAALTDQPSKDPA